MGWSKFESKPTISCKRFKVERDHSFDRLVRVKLGTKSFSHPIHTYGLVRSLKCSEEFGDTICAQSRAQNRVIGEAVFRCLHHFSCNPEDLQYSLCAEPLWVTVKWLDKTLSVSDSLLDGPRFRRGVVSYGLSPALPAPDPRPAHFLGAYTPDQLEAVTPDEFLADFVKYMALDSGRFDSGFIFR